MITKTIPSSRTYTHYGKWVLSGGSLTDYWNDWLDTGSSTISYGEGPIHLNHRVNWKPCRQVSSNQRRCSGSWTCFGYRSESNYQGFTEYTTNIGFSGNYSLPSEEADLSTCFGNILDQIDLNCKDSVLLYSGILQAVPLVGGAFKFVSVMNRAARKLSKSFKRKPFTTVVKTLIQGDFIDRFVVSPTIDDARKFLDASNYVVRVMNTAYERSAMPVRYEGKSNNVTTSKDSGRDFFPFSGGGFSGDKYLYWDSVTRKGTESKMFMLAEVDYKTESISPIKLWAARCGITKPLDSVWDLVPFSFVIDYFSRAGDFIAGLSNEMSSQDGLSGRIQRIHGCWSTIKTVNETSWTFTRSGVTYPQGWLQSRGLPFTVTRGSSSFTREPVNPWAFLPSEPSGFLRWDMSSTRYRTLLELWIQSKL